jgi:predicted metal-dependent hydrolase
MPSAPEAAGETLQTIAIGARSVTYALRRARRRTIGLTIDHRGLRVGAPQRASLNEVESLILQHGDWVGRKLDEWARRPPPALLQIVDGVQLPLLGRPLTVHLALGSNRQRWQFAGEPPTLTLCLRSPAEAARVLEIALRENARRLFVDRLAAHAPALGLAPPPLALSSARTRWGSCSRRGGVRLNWRLIHFPLSLIDYVVVHELAHLHEMNHSPRFWAIVARHCPDYPAARAELKRRAAACPHW